MKINKYTQGMDLSKPVIVAEMPNEAYHATEHLSASKLKLFKRSPAHLFCSEPREPTRAMDMGTAIHTAMLEPELFQTLYFLTEEKARTSSAYKAAAKAYGAEYTLSQPEAKQVTGMQQAAHSNPDYQGRFFNVPHHTELSFFGNINGIPVKCRFDLITEDFKALDLKKTQDASNYKFSRALFDYDYYLQEAFYKMVFASVMEQELQSFEFFVVEEKAPHSNCIYRTCFETQQVAEKELAELLDKYGRLESKAEGIFMPSDLVSLPDWILSREIEGAYND